MLDKRTLHLKVQELCDCYLGTDHLKQMSLLSKDADPQEAALKWLALAVLHGVDANADKIKISVREDGDVTVIAEYRETTLPSPGAEIGAKVIEAVRQITHFEKDREKGPLALGLQNDSLELSVEVKKKDRSESVVLKFPK